MRIFKRYLDEHTYQSLRVTKMISSFVLIGSIILVLRFYFFSYSDFVFYGTLILFSVIFLELHHNFKMDSEIHRFGFELLFIYTLVILISETNNWFSTLLFSVMIMSIITSELSDFLIKTHNKEVKGFLLIDELEHSRRNKYESFKSAKSDKYGFYYVNNVYELNLSYLGYWLKKVTIVFDDKEEVTIKTRRKKVYIAFFEDLSEEEFLDKVDISVTLSCKQKMAKLVRKWRS